MTDVFQSFYPQDGGKKSTGIDIEQNYVSPYVLLCKAFNCRIVYGHLCCLLIIVSYPSPTHSFFPGLKPSFSAGPSHRSLSFFYRAMQCIRGTSHGPVSVCVCVCLCLCPSVTSRCSTKTAKRRITQTTPHDTTRTLVF